MKTLFLAWQDPESHVWFLVGRLTHEATVERVNPPPIPLQFRVLCNLTALWVAGFEPFSSPSYQPLGEVPAALGG